MALTWWAGTQQHTIGTVQECPQDMVGIESCRTIHPNDAQVGWESQPAVRTVFAHLSCHICRSISTPFTRQHEDFRAGFDHKVLWCCLQGCSDLGWYLNIIPAGKRDGFYRTDHHAIAAANAIQCFHLGDGQDAIPFFQPDRVGWAYLGTVATTGA